MSFGPQRPFTLLLTLLASIGGCGYDLDSEGRDPQACLGACDSLGSALLQICTMREAASGLYGCKEASATDIGIDAALPEKKVSFRVALRSVPRDAEVALVLLDGATEIRRIRLAEISDGIHSVPWDGHDSAATDITAAFHTVKLLATYGEETATGNEHVIATLVNLPEQGPGFVHYVGSDARNSDDWGRVHVVEKLQGVAQAWTHSAPITILDISRQNGGVFPPHWMHRHGESVDIRYVRTDGAGPLDLRWHKAYYDRASTQQLADLLLQQGALEIFADPASELGGDNIVFIPGHQDHFHVQFGLTPEETAQGRPVNQNFVGGPCRDASDCPLNGGFCWQPGGGAEGICTVRCAAPCADRLGGIYTLSECVSAPAGRLCVPARDDARFPDSSGCRPDLVPRRLASLDRGGALTDVCLPEGS